jgi:hypothetical protein
MKRITVSLPDELVERIKRAAGGDWRVSAYVARALKDYQEREGLGDILAGWHAETPVPDEARQQAEAGLDQAGLTGQAREAAGRPDEPSRHDQPRARHRNAPHVVLLARQRHHAIVTSDPRDIARIDATVPRILV